MSRKDNDMMEFAAFLDREELSINDILMLSDMVEKKKEKIFIKNLEVINNAEKNDRG